MKTIIFVLLSLASIAFAYGAHLMEDGRRHIAFTYLSAGTTLTVLAIVLPIAYALRNRKPRKTQSVERGESINYSPALRKALARLKSLSDHLPTNDVSEHYVNEYHSLLDVVQAEIHQDLSAFHIPTRTLFREVSGISWEGANKGWQHSESNERFCKTADFRIALSGAMTFIDSCLYQIPLNPPRRDSKELESDKPLQLQTSDAPQTPEPHIYYPDDKDKKIIRYLRATGVDHLLPYIAEFVGIDTQIAEMRLNRLAKHGYIRLPRATPSNNFPPYRLTDKGIQFAIDNGLQDEQKPKEPEAKIEPPKLQDAHHQTSDGWQPDKAAIDILKQIDKGNSYESKIAEVLKLKPKQASEQLRLLREHRYVTLERPSERAPYYQLTEKAIDLLNKPVRTVPFPSSWPDELAKKVLLHIARTQYPEPVEVLSEELKLDPLVIQVSLDKLIQHHYVEDNWLAPVRGHSRYRLSATGRAYIVDFLT